MNDSRIKVMVCKELLLEVEKLYPEANSITSALQMHLVKTIKADQVVSQGKINAERQAAECQG